MNIPEIYDRMEKVPCRIEGMWPFPTSTASDSLLDALELFEALPAELSHLIKSWDEDEVDALVSGQGRAAADAWDILYSTAWDRKVYGFIAVVAVPVFNATGGGGASYSWGYYRHKLIFAKTAELLLERAAEFGEAAWELAVGSIQEGGAA